MSMGMGGCMGMGMGAGRPAKRAWEGASLRPDENNPDAKTISGMVGRINSTVALTEKISYSDVKLPLDMIGLEAAKKILKDIENSAGAIKNPTSYIIAAAKRASSGEGIPSKMTRF